MKTFIFIYFILVLGIAIDDIERGRKRKASYICSFISYCIVAAGITAVVATVIYFLVHL